MTIATESGSRPDRNRCRLESVILGPGIPAAIWCVSKIISGWLAAAHHGSSEERFFFYWFIPGVVVEWLFVAGLWVVLRRRGVGFNDLGV
jgi:hypothetical protein